MDDAASVDTAAQQLINLEYFAAELGKIFLPLVVNPTSVVPLTHSPPQFYPPTRHTSLNSTRTDGFRPSLTGGAHFSPNICTALSH